MLLPVLRRPALSLSSQAWRLGAGSVVISAGVSYNGCLRCGEHFLRDDLFNDLWRGFFLEEIEHKKGKSESECERIWST